MYAFQQRLLVFAMGCCCAATAQGQITWGPHVVLDESPLFEQTVDVATDHGGHWVVVWDYSTPRNDPDPGGVRFIRSEDNATSWSEPVSIADRVVAAEGRRWSPAAVGDASGAWMIAWSRELAEGGAVIEYIHSTDYGQTWADPQPLHGVHSDGAHNSDLTLAVASGGRWLAAWSSSDVDLGASAEGRSIVMAQSHDSGATWTTPTPLAPGPSEADKADRHPDLRMTDTGIAICVWHRQGPATDEASLFLARSEDFGGHWDAPLVLAETGDRGWREHHYGTVATDERGRWMVVWTASWRVRGDKNLHNFEYVTSEDDGLHWREPKSDLYDQNRSRHLVGFGRPKAALDVDSGGQWVTAFNGSGGLYPDFYDVAIGSHRQDWRKPWSLGTALHDDGGEASPFFPLPSRYTESWPRLKAGAHGTWVAAWTRAGAVTQTRQHPYAKGPMTLHVSVGRPPIETKRIQARIFDSTPWSSSTGPHFSVALTFSESVKDFNPAAHLIGDNYRVRGWRRSSDRLYYIDLAVRDRGPDAITVQLPAGSAAGKLGGVNRDSNVFRLEYEFGDVQVELRPDGPNQVVTGPITVRASFSECIANFDTSRILLENAILLGARRYSTKTWIIELFPTGTGPVGLYLERGAGQACHGVPSEPSELLQIPLGTVGVPDFNGTVGFPLDPAAEADAGVEREPVLGWGGGHHLAVWVGDYGRKINISRSTDDGQTWSPSKSPFSASLEWSYNYPSLAYDGSGRWVMAWSSPSGDASSGAQGEYKVLIAYSDDHGETWSNPQRLSAHWFVERDYVARTKLITDGNGNWVVVCSPENRYSEGGTFGARLTRQAPDTAVSTDNAATWSSRKTLGIFSRRSGGPFLTFDAAMRSDGSAMLVLATNDERDGSLGKDMDILARQSGDVFGRWLSPVLVNHYGLGDESGRENHPEVVSVGEVWLSAWTSNYPLNDEVNGEEKIHWSVQDPTTGTWSAAEALNDTSSVISGREHLVQLLQGDATTAHAFWLAEAPGLVRVFRSSFDLITMTWGEAELLFAIPGEKINDLIQAMDFAPASDGGWLGIFSSAKYYASMLGDSGDIFVSTSHGPDLLRPTVTLDSLAPPDSVAMSVEVTARFSHGVRAFEAEDVVVENAVVTDFQGVGHEYRFRVTALEGGPFHVEVPENVAVRYTGEQNLSYNRLNFSHDPLHRPAVYLELIETQADGIGPIQVDAHFTTPVTALDRQGIALSNGDVVGIGSGERVQRLSIRPREAGLVTVQILEGAVQGLASGLDNAASDVLETVYVPSDTALRDAPTVTLESDAPESVEGPFTITARFNIPVTGIDPDRIKTFRGVVTEVTGSGDTYMLQVQPELPGEVSVYLQQGAASSLTSVGSRESNVLYRDYAGAAPPLVLESVETELKGLTNRTVVPFIFRFNRSVTGFVSADALDVMHQGTTHQAINISGGPRVYTVEVVGLHGEGSFQITANPSGGIRDQNGNTLSSAATSAAVEIDTIPPSEPRILVMPRVVKPGGEVRLYIEPTEALVRAPEILLPAKALSRVMPAKHSKDPRHQYEVLLQIDPLEAAGPLPIQILLEDLAGNTGVHEERELVVVQDESGVPLPTSDSGAWWLVALLLLAGIFTMAFGGRRPPGRQEGHEHQQERQYTDTETRKTAIK